MADTGSGDAPRRVAALTTLPRGLVVVLGTTGLLVSVLALRELSGVVAPVLLALVVVIGVHPLTGALRRRGVPQWLAVVVTMIVAFAIIVGLALSLALAVAQLATVLPTYQSQFASLLGDLRRWLGTLGVGQEQLQSVLSQFDFGRLAGVVTGLLTGLVGVLTDLVFIVFVVVFMGIDAATFSRRMEEAGESRSDMALAIRGFVRGTRSYLVVSTIFGLIIAVLDGALLVILDVPLPVLWALLAFVTNYIPNIGFIIGLVPPALLGLLAGGPRLMIFVIVGYCVLNFVFASVIQPKYVSNTVNLSLTLTFLSVVFWSFVVGPIGAVLAIPLTLLAKALLVDADPGTRWMSGLLTGGSLPKAPAPAAVEAAPPTVEEPRDDVAPG
ncbi:MAG: AI-2E family transporter [Pseudonocardia sp.]|uniref:AI-2E family transporter n=1 Tax=unclassified Pseudonocardia TaxID=2619320 RepID=UPI00086BCDA5|nr:MULTISPECIES: AI-2E family transporter [unclassified Pseudonocardia]MBN9113393.1 AI-2E family transporter [Pseudonocardia sp.]ODU21153.1 MAG: AI-2E family transporter [Pseudonocardia sp. SCN 72-51]ODV03731.1 MAG: AI-2E family transporter [Pseudonocardia sp. SCN 73-27]